MWCSHYHLNFSASAGCFTVASKRFSVRCISCSSTLILPCLSTTCHRVILLIFLLCELDMLGYPHNFQIQTLSIFFFSIERKKSQTLLISNFNLNNWCKLHLPTSSPTYGRVTESNTGSHKCISNFS